MIVQHDLNKLGWAKKWQINFNKKGKVLHVFSFIKNFNYILHEYVDK